MFYSVPFPYLVIDKQIDDEISNIAQNIKFAKKYRLNYKSEMSSYRFRHHSAFNNKGIILPTIFLKLNNEFCLTPHTLT